MFDNIGKKIEVTYHSIDELEKRAREEQSQVELHMVKVYLSVAKGLGYIEPTLNKATQYKPVTVEEFIREWWV